MGVLSTNPKDGEHCLTRAMSDEIVVEVPSDTVCVFHFWKLELVVLVTFSRARVSYSVSCLLSRMWGVLRMCAIPSDCHRDSVFFIWVDACRFCVHVCVCVMCVLCVWVLCGWWCLLSSFGLCVCVNPFCETVFRSFAHERELISGGFFRRQASLSARLRSWRHGLNQISVPYTFCRGFCVHVFVFWCVFCPILKNTCNYNCNFEE